MLTPTNKDFKQIDNQIVTGNLHFRFKHWLIDVYNNEAFISSLNGIQLYSYDGDENWSCEVNYDK